jgi:hypothetical protein
MSSRCPLLVLSVSAMLAASAGAQAPAGSEFRVNTYTTSSQRMPAVAADASGNFVVVWQSLGPDAGYGIFGQRFSAAGAPRGAEFRVNTYTTSTQRLPAVAADANGNFVVVWQSIGQDGAASYGIFGQRFDAFGAPQGSEFRVNSYTTGDQLEPTIAAGSDGRFVVAWESDGEDGSNHGVFAQRFDAGGIAQGGEFQVNSYTTGEQRSAAAAANASGDFVVVWHSDGQDGSSYGIFGRRFSASGAAQGGEFQVNTFTTIGQGFPSVAADASGDFVVVWSGQGAGGEAGVFAQRFNASGGAQGSEFRVNSYTTGGQLTAAVASDADGNFVVVWRSLGQDGSVYGIFGQRFDASGLPRGVEFQVNSYTSSNQTAPAVASGADGDFVVVWHGVNEDGSLYGVFGQRYGDMIFEDGFESGDLSRWSSAATDGSDLTAGGAGAMAGTGTGLIAFVNDTNSLFVQDDTPNAESRYRVRFYFDTNGFDPGESQSHFRTRILIAQGSGLRVITIVLKRQLGTYSVEARVRRNDGTRADTGFFPISDGPHFFEFDWQRATGPGASNGSLQMWIDDGSVATLSGIDNDLVPVDQTRMGVLSVKTGAAGTLFYDQFESRRLNFIGAE